MQTFEKGRYRARCAETRSDAERAQVFRSQCFGLTSAHDADHLDDICTHVLIEERTTGDLVCYFRIVVMRADQLDVCYAAQFYDLGALGQLDGPLLEMGRFCIDPARKDPDILRLAWGALTRLVDRHNVRLLFGCTSFKGNEPSPYNDAFALLKNRHLAPSHRAPLIKAAETYDFAKRVDAVQSMRNALHQMPPLLRSYLAMGAWVSDHAVIDRALNTLHVFTGLEIEAIPVGRQRLLRSI